MVKKLQKQTIKKRSTLLLKNRLKKRKLIQLFGKKQAKAKLSNEINDQISQNGQTQEEEEQLQINENENEEISIQNEDNSEEQQSEIIIPLSNEDFQQSEHEEEEEEQEEFEQEMQQEDKEIINKHHLVKNWSPIFTQPSIYTGGRIQISNNEEFIASIANFKIIITDINTRKITNQIEHQEEELCNFALHPSNKYIATFTRNNTVRFVAIQTKQVLHQWKVGDQWAIDMAFDNSGQFLAIGCVDGFIKIFDVNRGILTHSYKVHKGSVTKLLFHPQAQKLHLISVGEDYAIRIYDMVISSVLKSIVAHENQITAIMFSENGSNLITVSSDGKICIWDYNNTQKQSEIQINDEIEAAVYFKIKNKKKSANKIEYLQYLAIADLQGNIKLIDISTSEVSIKDFSHLQTHQIIKLMVLQNKEQICSVTCEQNIIFYNYLQGPQLQESDIIIGYNDEITDLKFSKTIKKKGQKNQFFDLQKDYIITSTNSNIMKAIQLKDGKTQFIKGHQDFILCLDTFGPFLVSGGKDKIIKLWQKKEDSLQFTLLANFIGHIEPITSINISPKTGQQFVTGSEDKNIKIWDLKKYTNNKKVEDVTSSSRTILGHQKGINVVTYSPNEKLIASASQDKQIKIWEAEKLQCKLILKGHKKGVWDVQFSPVEKLLASASGDQTIKIWNLENGECVSTLEGHQNTVLKCKWISFGLQLISCGADALIKIWNAKKANCLSTIDKHNGKIWALDISDYDKEGKQYMISGGNDSNLFLWEDVTKEEEQKKKEQEHEVIIQQDNYQQYIRSKDFINAAKIAFQYNFVSKFHQALELLFNQQNFKNEIIYTVSDMQFQLNENEINNEEIENLIINFMQLDFNKLLHYIRDMNTVQKYSKVAQKTLNYVLLNTHINKFDELSKNYKKQEKQNKKKEENNIPNSTPQQDFINLLEILISYSQRHAERMEKFIKKSYYLDLVLQKIDMLTIQE